MKAKKEMIKEVMKRNLTPEETLQLQEMIKLINARKFEAEQIKNNTALVPDGQKVAEQIEAIARLLDNVRNQYVSQKLVECGYGAGQKCNINLGSGEIILTPDESKDSK